jgi:uncharacterized protein (TIGR02678 family)
MAIDPLAEVVSAERREAARALLRHPLLLASGPDQDAFVLARRHAGALAPMFRDLLGWPLVVDHRGRYVRLQKRLGAHADASRPAMAPGRTSAFTIRRYVLFCVACAELDSISETQTILSRLADGVTKRTQVDPQTEAFDSTTFAERRALVDVLSLLESLGVLRLREGDALAFLDGAEEADPFYDIEREILAALVATPLAPTLVEDRAELSAESYAPTERGRIERDRHGFFRRIIEDPVVYAAELTEGELAYAVPQRRYIAGELRTWFGLSLERRREGWAAIDPEGELAEGTRFPGEGIRSHAALLLADALAERLRGAPNPADPPAVSMAEIRGLCEGFIAEHRAHWPKIYLEAAAPEARLAADAVWVLIAYRLVERQGERVRPLPAIVRFAADPPVLPVDPGQAGEQLAIEPEADA